MWRARGCDCDECDVRRCYERNDEAPAAFWRLLAVCGLGLWIAATGLGIVAMAHFVYLAFLQF